MYRGETMAGVIADESRLDTGCGFAGGYYMETISLGPAFFASFVAPGRWGPELTQYLDDYQNTAGRWIVGEDMPQEYNRITLNTDVTDQHGLPVANVHFDDPPNDVAMREHGQRQGEAVYNAVGAIRTIKTPPYPSTHNLGTCRMSERPRWRRQPIRQGARRLEPVRLRRQPVHHGAGANPTLTIVALAIRQAEYIGSEYKKSLA